jgi:hypothetical protein
MYDEHLCDNDEDNAHHDHDFLSLYESLKTLSNSPMPLNCLVEQMIYLASRITFMTRQLSKCLGEPFRHFLNLSIEEEPAPPRLRGISWRSFCTNKRSRHRIHLHCRKRQ